jgi:hypothetical protein
MMYLPSRRKGSRGRRNLIVLVTLIGLVAVLALTVRSNLTNKFFLDDETGSIGERLRPVR